MAIELATEVHQMRNHVPTRSSFREKMNLASHKKRKRVLLTVMSFIALYNVLVPLSVTLTTSQTPIGVGTSSDAYIDTGTGSDNVYNIDDTAIDDDSSNISNGDNGGGSNSVDKETSYNDYNTKTDITVSSQSDREIYVP